MFEFNFNDRVNVSAKGDSPSHDFTGVMIGVRKTAGQPIVYSVRDQDDDVFDCDPDQLTKVSDE